MCFFVGCRLMPPLGYTPKSVYPWDQIEPPEKVNDFDSFRKQLSELLRALQRGQQIAAGGHYRRVWQGQLSCGAQAFRCLV